MLDPNIALQYKGMQLNDPMEQYGKAMALSQMGVQNQFMQQKMAEQQRSTQLAQMKQKAFSDAGGDPVKFKAALSGMGLHDDVAALDKSQLETQKTKSEMGDKLIGLRAKAAQFAWTGATPQHAAQAAQLLAQSGDMEGAQHIQQALEQFPDASPEQVKQFFAPHLALGQTPGDLLNPNYKDVGGELLDINPNTKSGSIKKTQTPESVASNQLTIRGQDLSAQTTREGHGVTMRGQNMVDTRAKDKNEIDAKNLPKLTEVQAKAQLMARRARESHKIATDLEGKYSPLAINAKMSAHNVPGIGGALGAVGNTFLSVSDQKVEQAQRDFVNGVLRVESGAVISKEEFDNARKQYFPQPGDSKAVISQKRMNRETALKGLEVMSGPGLEKQAQQPGNNIDSLLDKYK